MQHLLQPQLLQLEQPQVDEQPQDGAALHDDSQPQLFSQPQLLLQPQDGAALQDDSHFGASQPQLFSQPQLLQLLQHDFWQQQLLHLLQQPQSNKPFKPQNRSQWWQPQLLQQLLQHLLQPQDDSQPQLFSQPQDDEQPHEGAALQDDSHLGASQPQLFSQPQLLLQPQDDSQPQDFSQPQLLQLLQQVCSAAQHVFSQHCGWQQQSQPELFRPSMLSSNSKP